MRFVLGFIPRHAGAPNSILRNQHRAISNFIKVIKFMIAFVSVHEHVALGRWSEGGRFM